MTTLRVNIDNPSDAKALATFLRSLGYVKSVSIDKSVKPLSGDDWILPGRRATEQEVDQLLDDMDNDDNTGFTTEQMLTHLEEWKKR
ncbi:MAG TPA: hypothetical protein DCL77_12435 [Prolixibacteraceae bacterium]|nr:hypothetical protein [Prolixibacteraceae bacterium]